MRCLILLFLLVLAPTVASAEDGLLIDRGVAASGVLFDAEPAGGMLLDVPDRVTESQKVVVHLYSPLTWNCPHCNSAEAALKDHPGIDLRVHKDDELRGFFAGKSFPVLHWAAGVEGVGWQQGWDGEEQFLAKVFRDEKPVGDQDVAAAPTPMKEVERVLGLLPKPEVGFVDFGCGDGRWCIAAAERWGCRVTGVEIDPARAAATRERVKSVGLSHLVTIVTGDATKVDVDADVGVAYLYGDVLQRLQPKLQKLRAFASYKHQPPGLPVVKNGDTWLYFRGDAHARTAVWGGQQYAGPVCNDPNCRMCNSIRGQLGQGTSGQTQSQGSFLFWRW